MHPNPEFPDGGGTETQTSEWPGQGVPIGECQSQDMKLGLLPLQWCGELSNLPKGRFQHEAF